MKYNLIEIYFPVLVLLEMWHSVACEHVRRLSDLTEAVDADNVDSADIAVPPVHIQTTVWDRF